MVGARLRNDAIRKAVSQAKESSLPTMARQTLWMLKLCIRESIPLEEGIT